MLKNSFTLIDAFNQFWTVCEDGDRRALSCAGLTYFYLCRVWNATGRSISFRRLNTLICAELVISKPTLDRHRNVLKQSGLIDFVSKGKGDINITYKILDVRYQTEEVIEQVTGEVTKEVTGIVKGEVTEELKKANNITTSVVSPITSDDAYKQSKSKEKEFFVVVSGEKKIFHFLLQLFETDVGLQENYEQKGLPPGNFPDAVEKWMIQNNGAEYDDFRKARKHFLFWMPNYQRVNEKNHESTHNNRNRKTVAKWQKTGMDYAAGL